MSSISDINALREYIQGELAKVAVFMKTTNRTIQTMQESDVLLTDSLDRIHSAIEDFTEQISIQQQSIRELTKIVKALTHRNDSTHDKVQMSEQVIKDDSNGATNDQRDKREDKTSINRETKE